MSRPAPPAWRLQAHAELGSTQDAAIAAAMAGDPGRLAIRADRQTAGRGSRGRAWTAPAGNLNLSVLLRPAQNRADAGRWALLAGIALHDALAPHAAGLMLKWPNDLLLRGGKLGGILIDSQLDPDSGLDWLVIGFGANLVAAPVIPGRETACLPAAAAASRVAEAVLTALDRHDGMATPDLCAAWLRRAHPLGTRLDIRLGPKAVSGAFAGLAPDGALLIAGHAAPIRSGEVFLPRRRADAPQPGLAPCC